MHHELVFTRLISFKCKYGIKSVWGFLTSPAILPIIWHLFFSIIILCCLRELDLFRPYKPLYLMPMKAIWTLLTERGWGRVRGSVFLFIYLLLDRTSKTRQSIETVCSVCIIAHANMHKQASIRSQPLSRNPTNTPNHSSIFYARMQHSRTPL